MVSNVVRVGAVAIVTLAPGSIFSCAIMGVRWALYILLSNVFFAAPRAAGKDTTKRVDGCEDTRVCGELRDVPCGNPLRMIAFETPLACALTTS